MVVVRVFALTMIGFAIIVSGLVIWYSQHLNSILPMIIHSMKRWELQTDNLLKGDFCSWNITDIFREYIGIRNDKFATIHIKGHGTLVDRIKETNTVLTNVRNTSLEPALHCEYEAPGKISTFLHVGNSTYMRKVVETSPVLQILLSWIPDKHYKMNQAPGPNMLVKNYYQWIGSPTLCNWIQRGITSLRYHVVFNNVCETDTRLALKAIPLSILYWNARPAHRPGYSRKYPPYFYTDPPPYVTFLTVALNAVLTQVGDMYTTNVKISSCGCSDGYTSNSPGNVTEVDVYDEVFTVSQRFGANYFHKNIEEVPRLAPFLPFLLLHQNTMVHVYQTTGHTKRVLSLLGITSDRLIGGVVKAKIAYMPECTFSGYAHPANCQLLSQMYRNIIRNSSKSIVRKSIVQIRRSGSRKFTRHNNIKRMVKKLAMEQGLAFTEFIDNPVPSLEETMKIFNSAVMVIGPHGAGFSNILFSEPGTFIIEAVCNRPHVQMCFTRLAHILGHRWHGIESRRGCSRGIDVDVTDLEKIIRTYITHAVKLWEK